MKQFSLEEYLKNPERKIITRDGKEVRILCTDRKSVMNLPPIIALVKNRKENEEVFGFFTNGKYFYGGSSENNKDLFFAPEKHEGWVNIYKNGDGYWIGETIYNTKKDAKKYIGQVATIKIGWEE